VVVAQVALAGAGPLAHTSLFLGSAVLLQVLFAAGAASVVGQVWRHR
jgi:hypothetical protein